MIFGLRPKAQDSLSVMAASAEWSAMRASARLMPTAGAGSRRDASARRRDIKPVSDQIHYLIGYTRRMVDAAELLERVRVSSGLTQEELAHRAGTSRPTLSAYERGRKSPTVATFARLLAQAGWDLAAEPHVSFTEHTSARGKPIWVPDRLPRVDVGRALAAAELPLHLNWSAPGRVFDLRSRADRARVYEIVLQEGTPADIVAYIDGALLVDLWKDLVLPRAVRSAWASLVCRPSEAGA
jgi:transcriptional regulator with XRE-family HTH domain